MTATRSVALDRVPQAFFRQPSSAKGLALVPMKASLPLAAAVLAALRMAAADPYRLGIWVRDSTGQIIDSQRIWYGDGTSNPSLPRSTPTRRASLAHHQTHFLAFRRDNPPTNTKPHTGQVYVGANIPSEVTTAFNITCAPSPYPLSPLYPPIHLTREHPHQGPGPFLRGK